MSKITSEECEWCNGSGVDPDGINLGNPYKCTECRGTGFKYGLEGKSLYYKQLDESEKDLIEWGLL